MAITEKNLKEAMETYLPEVAAELDDLPRFTIAITSAFRRLSEDKPRTRAAELTANPAATPAEWDNDFSTIVEANWPYLQATNGVIQAQKVAFTVDDEPGGNTYKIRLPNSPVSGTSKARIVFTRLWKLADIAELPGSLEDPIKVLASSIYADMLAGFFETAASPSAGGAQLLDAGAKADSYRDHARALMEAYGAMLGIPVGNEAAEV